MIFFPTGSIRFGGMIQQFPLPSLHSAVAGWRKSCPVSVGLYGFEIGIVNRPCRQMGCEPEEIRTVPATVAQSFVVGEEEGLVLDNRAANGRAKLISQPEGLGNAVLVGKEI